MNRTMEEAMPGVPGVTSSQAVAPSSRSVRTAGVRYRPQTLLAIPVGALISLGIHYFIPKGEPVPTSHYFPTLLFGILGFGVLLIALCPFSPRVRNWMRRMCPILGVATLMTGMWELITCCLALMPLPYFPGPEAVMSSIIHDAGLIFDSTWHSLFLLLSGYAIGTSIALVTGVTIGWFPHARYWGMPLLKVIGPIPATAWIPLAMVLAPSALFSLLGVGGSSVSPSAPALFCCWFFGININ